MSKRTDKYPAAALLDAHWVRLCVPDGGAWAKPSGFSPNREAQLVDMGVLVPAQDGFTVHHEHQRRIGPNYYLKALGGGRVHRLVDRWGLLGQLSACGRVMAYEPDRYESATCKACLRAEAAMA